MVDNEAGREPALAALQELVKSARVEAMVQTIVSEKAFAEILYQHSADAICVMLGFEIPENGSEETWYTTYCRYVENLPTTILVNSQGEEGLLA